MAWLAHQFNAIVLQQCVSLQGILGLHIGSWWVIPKYSLDHLTGLPKDRRGESPGTPWIISLLDKTKLLKLLQKKSNDSNSKNMKKLRFESGRW